MLALRTPIVPFLAVLGCATNWNAHPCLRQQLQTRELEVVHGTWPHELHWFSGEEQWDSGRVSFAGRITPPPPLWIELHRALSTLPGRVADAAVALGTVNGVRLVGSARQPPAQVSALPRIEDAPPGRAVFAFSLERMILLGRPEAGGLLIVSFEFSARELTSPLFAPNMKLDEWPNSFPGAPTIARAGSIDPTPRTLESWLADDARLLREAYTRAADRAARQLVSDLVVMVGGRSWAGCGPKPELPTDGLTGVAERGARLSWKPWPWLETGRATYDLRVFRFDGLEPHPILEQEGLESTKADLPPLAPGTWYGWTVRAALETADGRRLLSPWSYAQHRAVGCSSSLDASKTWRFETGGEVSKAAAVARTVATAARALPESASPPSGASAQASPPPDSSAPLPPRARRAGLSRVKVTPLDRSLVSIEYLPAAIDAGPHIKKAVGEGVVASVQCLVLFPVCAALMVPVGIVVGGVVAQGDPPKAVTLARVMLGLREAVTDPAVQERLEDAVRAATPAAEEGESDATLEVGVVRAAFIGGKRDDPTMTLQVDLGARLVLPDGAVGYRIIPADFTTPLSSTLWLRQDGELLRGTLGALAAQAAPLAVEAVLRGADGPAPPARKPVNAPPKAERATRRGL